MDAIKRKKAKGKFKNMGWKNIYSFDILGIPKAQPRPRLGRYQVFNPDSAERWKDSIKIKTAHLKPLPYGPIKISIIFLFPRPSYLLKKSVPLHSLLHFVKPDIDNLLKAVMDALKDGHLFKDDCQIASVYMEKRHVMKDGIAGAFIQLAIYEGEENEMVQMENH
jgi:Holliday junction resolvase RusA-like endonuclease